MLEELTRCFREIGEDQELARRHPPRERSRLLAGHDLSEMVGREGGFYRDCSRRATP